jgi:hypothetical protein
VLEPELEPELLRELLSSLLLVVYCYYCACCTPSMRGSTTTAAAAAAARNAGIKQLEALKPDLVTYMSGVPAGPESPLCLHSSSG